MTIRVLLADDQALLRGTFKLLLDAVPEIEVVGEASTGFEAVERVRTQRADVVLMDNRMPGLDSIEATRRITVDEALAGVKTLVLTTFEADELVMEAVRAGASDFLGKEVEPEELIRAIFTISAGESLLSPVATTALSLPGGTAQALDEGASPHGRLAVPSFVRMRCVHRRLLLSDSPYSFKTNFADRQSCPLDHAHAMNACRHKN